MAMTEARKRANKKWNDAHMKEFYERVTMIVPRGQKKTIEMRAKEIGTGLSGYLNMLVKADLGVSDDEWKGIDTKQP